MRTFVGLCALALAVGATAQLAGNLGSNVSNVRYATIASGTDVKTNSPGLYVLTEPSSWGSYWAQHHNGAPPRLEQGFFLKWRLVAIHSGNRSTGGYGLVVNKIVRRIDRATINATELTPPPRARNTQAITSPWVLMRVERGAFDFDLQTRQATGYPATSGRGVTQVQAGGATITFGPP
jgi:hypothetical protein